MNKTNDFKFNLPAYSDPVDVEDLNDNFRGIDDALMAGLCKKDYTGNNMGSSDPSARKYAWAPWLEIVNDNEFDVVVTDRNAPVGSEEATINIAAGQTFRKYINGRYYMNFYVQDQHDVTFKWFTNAETYINESGGGGGGTGTVTSVSVQGGSGSHLTGSGNPIETSGTITINVDEGYSIPSDNEQTAWDGKAADLKLEINSSTYVITAQLKDSSGNLIGNERTIDLPLESVVVSGTYDDQTKKVILTLQNGSTIEFSVADLVSGLQTELSASNKLDPDYIDYDSTHRAVTDTEKDTWNGKQNAISDLETIRSGATAGATAVQPSAMQTALAGKQDSLDQTQLAAVNSGIDSSKVGQISTNQSNILSVLNRTGKNIVNIQAPTSTRGCTFVEGNNGAVTITNTENWSQFIIENVHVKTNTQYKLVFYTDAISNLPVFNVYLRDHDKDGSALAEGFTVSNTGTIVKDFTSVSDVVILNIYPNNQSTTVSGTATIRVMICEKTLYDLSNEYTWGIQNYDLTRLEAEDRASLAEVVDSGAKNLLQNTGTTTTISGVTFTVNSDGSVSTYGTSTANDIVFGINPSLTFKSGTTYVLSGCPTGGSPTGYRLCTMGSTYMDDYGNGNGSVNVGDNTSRRVAIYIKNSGTNMGTAQSPKTFKPMVCTKAAFGVSKAFVPFGNDPFYQVPINHNMIYRGRNLGATLTDAQHTALSGGNFTDLYLGDYWTKSVTIPAGTYTGGDSTEVTVPAQTNITLKAVIADFDTFYAGYASTYAGINTHHAAVIVTGFSNVVWNGTNSTAGGYVNSLIHKWLVGSALPQIETWFGSAKVLSHQKLLTNAITGDAASGWAWSSQKISLLSENQMYGSKVWGNSEAANGGYEPGEAFKHLNVFNHIDANLLFGNKNIWLREIASAAGAANLNYRGVAGNDVASYSGVAPAALILLS